MTINPSHTDAKKTPKPPRPLGLTLAIVGGLLFFFIIPMLEVTLIVLLDNTFIAERGVSMAGINVYGINYTTIIFQAFLSCTYFVIALMTASGRVMAMRFIFPLTTVLLALMHIFMRIIPLLTMSPNFTEGFDSASELTRQYALGYLVMIIIITIYTLWFLNRWSSRAFFRRYYTPADLHRIEEIYG